MKAEMTKAKVVFHHEDGTTTTWNFFNAKRKDYNAMWRAMEKVALRDTDLISQIGFSIGTWNAIGSLFKKKDLPFDQHITTLDDFANNFTFKEVKAGRSLGKVALAEITKVFQLTGRKFKD